MLVLSRKHGEEIVIGGDVRITIVAVQKNRVKLGITAPLDVVIRRAELEHDSKFIEVDDHSPQLVHGHTQPQLN